MVTNTTKANALHGILTVEAGANIVDLTTRDTITDDLAEAEAQYEAID